MGKSEADRRWAEKGGIATLQHYFEQNDGYSYQSRLRGVLKGLGFARQ